MRRPPGTQLEYHLLVLVTLALVAFGLVMVYSASSARALLGSDDPAYYLKRQALFAVLGLVGTLAALLPARRAAGVDPLRTLRD